MFILLLILFFIIIMAMLSSIRIVPQANAYVVERLEEIVNNAKKLLQEVAVIDYLKVA